MNKINYLAIIPARKNSKRIKNKNLVKIKNKELIKYTIESAKKVKKIGNIIVTSNDNKILNIAKKYKVSFLKRPKNISGSKSKTEDAILHTYNHLINKKIKVQNIIILQPTSPLRNSKHITACINLFERKKFNSIFSACKKKAFIWKISKNKLSSYSYNFKKRNRTQEMDNLIFENGAIYIFSTIGFLKHNNRLFGKIGVYFMNKINSIDIDDIDDINLIKKILN